MASLGVFTAGIAHEINNPNHIIRMNAAFLDTVGPRVLSLLDEAVEGDDSVLLGGMEYREFRKRYLQALGEISECSGRIDSIIRDLKDYTRSPAEDTLAPVDINTVVRTALRLAAPFLRKATERFEECLVEGLPPVRGNSRRLEQVVINLLQNACQALSGPEEPVRIETRRDEDGGGVVLTVTDGGRGIPAELIPKITDPLFTTRRESGGTGLGLSISSTIVRQHGGTLTVTSTEGQGTCVRVILPKGESE